MKKTFGELEIGDWFTTKSIKFFIEKVTDRLGKVGFAGMQESIHYHFELDEEVKLEVMAKPSTARLK